jgi:hypothetical protein
MNVQLRFLFSEVRSDSPAAVISSNADCGDSDINTSKRFLEVPEDGAEENTALSPFSLEPFDGNAPNGLFELPFSLFLDISNFFYNFFVT